MARYTQRELSRLFTAKKAEDSAAVATLRLVVVGTDKRLRFVAYMTIGGDEHEVAADNGKVKVFGDVDDFLKYAAKAAEAGDGVYEVKVDTAALLASTVPANMQTWAENQIVRLGKTKVKQGEVIAGIDAQLTLMGGWENGNAAQRAKKAELQAQKAAVTVDIAAIETEIARLQAFAG